MMGSTAEKANEMMAGFSSTVRKLPAPYEATPNTDCFTMKFSREVCQERRPEVPYADDKITC